MRDRVRRFIEENNLLKKGDKVIVALSGGADSVSLIHVLFSLKEEYVLELFAAHFNHGIRGDEANRDETFVTELCQHMQIPLYSERADVPTIAEKNGESEELCGRNLRYRFFNEVAEKLGGAKVATAHHRDDNVETVLWNLARGSGIGGLSGIPVMRENIIRPLLCCSRADIETYCAENLLDYVTDSTNLSDDYTRNKIRHQVVPVLRELNPNVDESIAQTASLMREADSYLNKISIEELNKAKNSYGYDCEKLLQLEPTIIKYAVKKVMEDVGAPINFHHITLIIEAMRTKGAVNLGKGYTAICAQGILRLTKSEGSTADFCVPFTEYIKTHGKRITVKNGQIADTHANEKIHNLLLNHAIPCDIITPDTVVRCRRAGDTFTDARRGVTKTLKKLMNELKIPRELRDTIPVVTDGSTVLWLQGYRTSAQAKADPTRDGDYIVLDEG